MPEDLRLPMSRQHLGPAAAAATGASSPAGSATAETSSEAIGSTAHGTTAAAAAGAWHSPFATATTVAGGGQLQQQQPALQQPAAAKRAAALQGPEHHQLRTALAGAVAAAVARVFVQPLDVLKIRFQLQVEPLHRRGEAAGRGSKYTSMWQAIGTIGREEGVRAFWKGHTPAQVLSVAYGVAQFWTYERLKTQSKRWNLYAGHRDGSNFVCGTLAGALGTFVITPLDVIRTRLIAQDDRRGYTNMRTAAASIVRQDGIGGLYRGLWPGMCQVGLLTGINFMTYNRLGETSVELLRLESKSQLPAVVSLLNGALAGLISKAAVYPLDLAKKRLQIQGFGEHRRSYGQHFQCSGVWHCFRATVRQEGVLGLYKGMTPSIWKAGVTSAINFCIYDNIVAAVIRSHGG